ncbi:PAS domain S-box protein [Methylophaga sp. OBS4]|uniref:PAS domain S-box protein n=1 Tax=Methylophaga sp. OBS4 TaxID=2991935 RepID=UPI00225C0640|nr:PAS domain S-box protein [Methylophaga sp. OBS4]MCX4187282.1 PAS domain S-box protein [Methylophaga sp. OBS4]
MKRNGFGERLKELIKQKQLTQAQVASAIGTSIPSVNRWTKGGEIEYDNLRALSDFLEVNWIWLRYGDDAIESLKSITSENKTMTDMRREYLTQILDNEARMKSALKMAQIVNWEWNVLTGTLNLSDNAESVFGCAPDNVRQNMLPFADQPIEEIIELFRHVSPYTWDFRHSTTPDGIEKWFTSTGKLVFDTLQRPVKVIGVTTDISARKNAELALERSEYMLRKIIETIPVGLWVADKDGTICLANPEVKRIWGGAKYVGLDQYGEYKGWWEKNGEEVGPEGWTLARAVKEGEATTAEVVNIEAFDGERRTIIMYSTPLYDNDKNIIGAIEINQDISEAKNTERSLKHSLEQWQAVFEQELFDLIQLDSNLTIKRLSQRLEKQLSIPLKNGAKLSDLIDMAMHVNITKKLQTHTAADVHAFKVSGKYNNSDQEHVFHIIHDNRMNDEAMILIFSF